MAKFAYPLPAPPDQAMSEQHIGQIQKQTQALTVTPQLRLALKVLQASTLELRSTIAEELQLNPVLEELPGEQNPLNEKTIDADSLPSFDATAHSHSSEATRRRQRLLDSLASETSLQETLMRQARLSDLPPETLRAFEYLVGSLDDRGFLAAPLPELSQSAGIAPPELEQAHLFLKTLEPPGIGSIDLRDCLLTQLTLEQKQNTLAFRIVRDHLSLLLRKRVPDLSRKLEAPPEAIQKAIDSIARLDPAPGRKFAQDSNRVIEPDITVLKENAKWIILLNNDHLPRLRLNQNYKGMIARGGLKTQEKQYIQSKLQSGKFLINAIEQRQQTLHAIASQLLTFQEPFFEKGETHLRPLSMAQIAAAINTHEATVSRAIANKYIATPYGVLPLRRFFASGYAIDQDTALANTSVKEAIAKIIASENPAKPYSDQKIVTLLKERSITIARRTVAKYRDSLNILPAHLRREYR